MKGNNFIKSMLITQSKTELRILATTQFSREVFWLIIYEQTTDPLHILYKQ
jgi:hypothetical protein